MAPVLCSTAPEIKIGHIDDIQELWKSQSTAVPDRYVRDIGERPSNLTGLPSASSPSHIPLIDLSKLNEEKELAKLANACQEWGFFQIVNHGIEHKLMESMEMVAKNFFMQPLEEKEKYVMAPGTVQGYGHAFVFSEDQKLDWCNMFALGVEPSYIRNPRLWPTNPAYFSETLELYSTNIRTLCQKILSLIAQTLGLPPAAFTDTFGEAVQAVRMNYYPPCPRPDLVLGLSPHSDGSALTILQQDTSSIGLQILKDHAWIPVSPIPGALVVNIGDTIEVLTNGMYKSVEHRVVTNKDIDRLSVVTFYAPGYDVELGPLAELVSTQQPCIYRRYNHGDYSRHYVTNKLQGKRSLEFAKIISSI